MKENRITVRINRSLLEVFAFTIDPTNTPRWIDSLVEEHIDTSEVGIGTRYTNTDKKGQLGSYIVSQFEKNKLFRLDSITSTYRVRYTYTPISENETELEYFEWVEEGDIEGPFEQNTLNQLKIVMEVNSNKV